MNTITRLFSTFGILRLALISLALFCLLMRPVPGDNSDYAGLQIVTTLMPVVLTPIVFMLLLLDALMCLVMSFDKPPEQRQRYRYMSLFILLLAVTLISYWTPYYISLTV